MTQENIKRNKIVGLRDKLFYMLELYIISQELGFYQF